MIGLILRRIVRFVGSIDDTWTDPKIPRTTPASTALWKSILLPVMPFKTDITPVPRDTLVIFSLYIR